MNAPLYTTAATVSLTLDNALWATFDLAWHC